ncbi:MAG: DinB family protein [Planctomycetota bacterium]
MTQPPHPSLDLSPGCPEPLTAALRQEFAEGFRMFRDAVDRLNDTQWGEGEPSWTEVPARATMHTLLCAAFYIAPSREGFDWEPGGVRYWEDPVHKLPDRAATRAQLERVAADTDRFLRQHGDEGLLREPAESAGQNQTRVAWMVYALRHLQHHVAQLSAECKRRGLGAAAWE